MLFRLYFYKKIDLLQMIIRGRGLLISILFFLSFNAFSQPDWLRYRYEINGGIGPSFFLGELGGGDGVGRNNILDLNWRATRFGGHFGGRYFLHERFAVQGSFTFGLIHGDDKNTQEYFRSHRDVSFRSPIYEFHTRVEYKIRKERDGHRYDLRGVRGQRAIKLVTYAYFGVGVFYFNPQAKIDGTWIDLRPIGTEGQNYLETRSPYSRFSLALIPGLLVKYKANRHWAYSMEIGPRFLFTDYLDDASTTYANPRLVAQHQNSVEPYLAMILADPAYEKNQTSSGGYTYYNEQRGNPHNNDFYMFVMMTVHYKLRANRNGWPTFQQL